MNQKIVEESIKFLKELIEEFEEEQIKISNLMSPEPKQKPGLVTKEKFGEPFLLSKIRENVPYIRHLKVIKYLLEFPEED